MKRIIVLLLSILVAQGWTTSEPIFKRDSRTGRPIYSSKPISEDSTVADLPSIEKGERTLSPNTTCSKHGGVSCSLGRDADGSVICLDGANDSVQRFDEHCEKVRLEVSEISKRVEGGAELYLRNRSAVVARDVVIVYSPRLGRIKRFNLGKNIEPFEEVSFELPASQIGPGDRVPALGEIELRCSNCPKLGHP